MGKTLYLAEKNGLKILRDGPSLYIIEDGKAGRRVPVNLIDRVVIIGGVDINSLVITLFTDNNIPVTFLNRRGEEIAVALTYNRNISYYYHTQRIFLNSTENVERFKNIIKSWRHRIQLDVIRRLSKRLIINVNETGFTEKDYEKIIDACGIKERHLYHQIHNIISGLFRELIISQVLKVGLDPHIGVLHRRHNFGFVLDIYHMLNPEEDMQAIQFLRNKNIKNLIKGEDVSSEGIKEIVVRFENRKDWIINKIEQIFDDIFEAMRELKIEGSK